jgi:hypothetical protein
MRDAEFFTACIAFMLAVLWWFHDRLKRIEKKLDKMGKM